jgi:hypothetical protein
MPVHKLRFFVRIFKSAKPVFTDSCMLADVVGSCFTGIMPDISITRVILTNYKIL